MRKLSVLLAVLMVLLMLVPTVVASEELDLEQAIIDAMLTGENADLSRYDIDQDDLSEVYTKLYQTGRLPWFANHSIEWTETGDGTIVEFNPKSLDELGFDEDLYERKIGELILATCREGMTDWQKALSVHDYMAMHIIYDDSQTCNTGYEALTEGTSACEGYAQLYLDVMRRIGIPCQIAECDDTGDGIGHAWNLIRLENEWYHVDVTWDDATPDVYGRVLHTHFLRTDSQFDSKENGHDFGWVAFEECNGKKYSENMLWEGVESAVAFSEDGSMYIQRSVEGKVEISKVLPGSMNAENIYSGSQTIVNLGDGDCYFPTMGLTMWNGRLYFNTSEAVCSVDLSGADERTEFAYEVSANQKVILGSFVDLGSVYMTLSDSQMAVTQLIQPVADGEYHTHSYVENGTVEPSCSSDGGTLWQCSCGASYIGDKIPALAHNLVAKEGEGTDGRTLYECSECGYSFDEPELQKQAGSGSGVLVWIIVAVVVVLLLIILFKPRKRRY